MTENPNVPKSILERLRRQARDGESIVEVAVRVITDAQGMASFMGEYTDELKATGNPMAKKDPEAYARSSIIAAANQQETYAALGRWSSFFIRGETVAPGELKLPSKRTNGRIRRY